jgi:hypothetical protein
MVEVLRSRLAKQKDRVPRPVSLDKLTPNAPVWEPAPPIVGCNHDAYETRTKL